MGEIDRVQAVYPLRPELRGADSVIASAHIDDLAVGDLLSYFSWSGDASYNLTGIVAPTKGAGRFLLFRNADSSDTLTLTHNDSSSASANRFLCPGSASFALAPGEAVMLYYNGFNWLVLANVSPHDHAGDTLTPAEIDLNAESTGEASVDFFGDGTRGARIEMEAASATGSMEGELDIDAGKLILGDSLTNIQFGVTRRNFTISPTSGTINDWSQPDGSVNWLCGGAVGAVTLTGIVAPPGAGTIMFIQNNSGQTFTLKNNDAGSAAANRFNCPGAGDFTWQSWSDIMLLYIGNRWTPIANG